MSYTSKNVAFALGGLAGNLAHGAGFLQGAIDKKIKPEILSCSSGLIFWVYKYLLYLDNGGETLEKIFKEQMKDLEPTGNVNINYNVLLMRGVEHFFRPAVKEMQTQIMINYSKFLNKLMWNMGSVNFYQEFLDIIPVKTLTPLFSHDFFEDISNVFNNSNVGVVFNSYHAKQGIENVYLNEKARKLLGVEYGQENKYRDRTVYKNITPGSVKAGLWLYQYGFDSVLDLDGAYYRQIILSELVSVPKIYVLRPIKYFWQGEMPDTYTETEDMKTEIMFNAAYSGERDKIMLINKLIDEKKLPADYHKIELVEIEIKNQESFFDYIFERKKVFDYAREKAKALL